MNIIHIIMKVKDQETYFDDISYPHFEVGWKKEDEFHSWNGKKFSKDEIESWKEI